MYFIVKAGSHENHNCNPMITENKFKAGEIVCEKIRPSQRLIVEKYSDNIYYCKFEEAPHRKAVVYVERDLTAYPKALK